MHIFLDESGTHKQEGKSSLVLVCVEADHLPKLESAIVDLEHRLRIDIFHWSENPWPIREKFLASIARHPFSIRVAIIQNPFRARHAYGSPLNELLKGLDVDSLIIDGKKGKSYKRRLKKSLRDGGISVNNLKTVKDDIIPVLRLADACAGLIRYYA